MHPRSNWRARISSAVLLLGLAGCGDDVSAGPDGGPTAERDGGDGVFDGGVVDGGAADGGSDAGASAEGLDLPRIPWEGGPAYWSRFPRATAAGMTEPSFFPVSVFFGKPEHAAALQAIGVNVYQGAEHDGSTLESITDLGILVLAQGEWTVAEIGDNDRVVGYHVSDECDMGYSGCANGTEGDAAEQFALATQRGYVEDFRARADGRFLQANFGNGVLKTFWATDTMDDHVAFMDVVSVDKYAYTSPHVRTIIDGDHDAPDWPNGAPVDRAYAYGWLTDSLRSFMDPSRLTPIWPFIETARPYLTEDGATTITTEQFEGAVWSAIIHEARGLSLFQHNDGPVCGNYSLVDCDAARLDAIEAVLDEVHALAPVINTQSYQYDFDNGTDTMLKTYDGHAYIFAALGFSDETGTKTFVLPPGIDGVVVTVVGEDRTIPVTDGAFTDALAAEHRHHVYRIEL